MKVILADFIQSTETGFYCEVGDFYIDPKKPVRNAIISHAHADHAIAGSYHVHATAATMEFMKLRYKNKVAKEMHFVEFHKSFSMNNVNVTFLPAGHILGSAQIKMEYNGVVYLYSGDVKSQIDSTCEPIYYTKTDVLITESTFANPKVIHPDPKSECLKIVNASKPLAIGCYVLGKAQRLTAILAEFNPDFDVFIHRDMLPYHKIYERFGFLKAKYKLLDKKGLKNIKPAIYLIPPLTFATYQTQNRMPVVFASGWENLQTNKDISFLLSDHMDWNDLLFYIEQVNPQEIWTIHGDGMHLKAHFEGSNVKVKILK